MIVAMAATRPALRPMDDDDKPKRNLKILPKDISHEDLDKVMKNWATALGVKCSFCHAPSQDSTSHRLDFASDAKPEKEITRTMMRMTLNINKRWLKIKHPKLGDATLIVQCSTCHNGQAFPDGAQAK